MRSAIRLQFSSNTLAITVLGFAMLVGTASASSHDISRQGADRPIGPLCERDLAALIKQRNTHTKDFNDYLKRREALEENLPAYARDVNSIYYHFDQPGLTMSVEQGPYKHAGASGTTAKNFSLDYDPSKFSRASIIRQTLGDTPRHLSLADVNHFGETLLMGEEGSILEIYLKGRPGNENDGGLIMVARDTGQVRFYAPGTDVDATVEGARRGSLAALWRFAKGVAGEIQCATCKYKGEWFTDKQIVDVKSSAPSIDHSAKQNQLSLATAPRRKEEWDRTVAHHISERRNPLSAEERDSLPAEKVQERIRNAQQRIGQLDSELRGYERRWEEEGLLRERFFESLKARRAAGEKIDIQQAAREQIAFEKDHPIDDIAQAIDEARTSRYYYEQEIAAAERAIERIRSGSPKPSSRRLPIEYTFHGSGKKDAEAAYREIEQALGRAGWSPDQVYLRFIVPHREDLARLYGTDRHGLNQGDARKFAWDTDTLAPALRARGLTLEDGLYVLDCDFRTIPRGFFESFLSGELSLVVYDKKQIVPLEWDYAAFKDPARKRDALIGVVTAKN